MMLITTKASRMSPAVLTLIICGILFLLTTNVLSTTFNTAMSLGVATVSKYPFVGIDALLATIAASNVVLAVASVVSAAV